MLDQTLGQQVSTALFAAITAAATRVENTDRPDDARAWADTAEALSRAVENITDAGRES